jgi:hypothetical protein
MNDKRSESTHPSARPPLPSIAPPTEDIDSEWGADEAPAQVPQIVPSPAVEAAPLGETAAPAAAPSYPPAPEPPQVDAFAAAPAPAVEPLRASATGNPLRKQTLLGIAPVIPQSPDPAVASKQASEPPRPNSGSSAPPRAAAALTLAASNPLRKQTLLGIAPVIPQSPEPSAAPEPQASEPPAAAAEPSEPSTSAASAEAAAAPPEPATEREAEPSVAKMDVAQPAVANALSSDTPVMRDVKSSRPPAPRVEMSSSSVDGELPELRPRRSRWAYVVAAGALLGGAVFALRQMDRAPAPLDESLARPIRPAAEPPAAPAVPKASEDEDDDADSNPSPAAPTEPELDAKAPSDSAASAPAAPSAAAPSSSASAASAGETTRISIDSVPPGARLFWRGKEVGTTPFTLEIPVGARRSYELGKPGFVTRRVVIDGSKSEISIGLKPQG